MKKIILFFLIVSLIIGMLELFNLIKLTKTQTILKFASISIYILYELINKSIKK